MQVEEFEGKMKDGKKSGKLTVTLPNEDTLAYNILRDSKVGAIVKTSKEGLKTAFPCLVGPEPKDCLALSKYYETGRISIQYFDSKGEI